MSIFNLKYSSVMASDEQMLNDITDILANFELDDSFRQNCLLCISEAFTNALVHGNKLNPEKYIIIHLDVNNSKIVADIIDEGTGGVSKIKHKNPPGVLAESGRGIDFMKHYATKVDFNELENGGLKVTIVVNRMETKIKTNISGGSHGN